MPNWCNNTLEITAKEETIQWIVQHVNDHIGRRFDDPFTRIDFQFVMGDEVWYSLFIAVRTSGTQFNNFLDLLLAKFKNIHYKGHFYVEGGFGGGDYEEGTDEAGNKYKFYTPIPDSTDYDEEEYYNFLIQEFPQEGEHEWDAQRIQQPHWYEKEELEQEYINDVELHDIWKDIEKEDQEEIEQLTHFEICGGCECRSYYYGQYHQDYDNDWTTCENWLQCWREEQDEIEQWELEKEIPTDEELAFDQCRTDHQAIFATADNECFKIKNVEQYERNERELNSILISDDIANDFLKDLEEQTDMPTEEELNYHVYDLLLEDERADFLYDSDPYQYIGQYYTRDDWEWVTYDQAIHNILFEEKCRLEEDEFWRHTQDYEDYVIYLDETPMYEDEDEIPGWDELEFDELRVDHSSVFERAEELGLKIRNFEDYERYYDEIYEDLWKEEVYRELQEEEEILNDIPTEEELEQDYINDMDFDEWRDYMYKIGKPLRILKKA
jgi:hypothetical protein